MIECKDCYFYLSAAVINTNKILPSCCCEELTKNNYVIKNKTFSVEGFTENPEYTKNINGNCKSFLAYYINSDGEICVNTYCLTRELFSKWYNADSQYLREEKKKRDHINRDKIINFLRGVYAKNS